MNLLLWKSGSLRDSALKNTTKALIGLLAGKHRGKRMVKL
jgi:NADPH-dependent curcumin reductase CurA